MKKNIIYLSFLLSISSCISHTGFVTSTSNTDNKTTYKDVAVGYSSYKYIFNIGGFNNITPLNDAKKNMYLSSPLKGGQSYQNLIYDIKTTYFWPFEGVKVFVLADIVETADSSKSVIQSESYTKQLQENQLLSANEYNIGEKVNILYKEKATSAKIVRLYNKFAIIYFIGKDGKNMILKKKYDCLFKSVGSIKTTKGREVKIGDLLAYQKSFNSKPNVGKVILYNSSNFIVEVNNKLVSVSHDEIGE